MGTNQCKMSTNLEQVSELTEEKIKFLLENTGFNIDEIQKWYTGFIVSIRFF
jgi:hypothetical protein